MKVVLAIDIGGTFTKIGLVDKAGEVLSEFRFRTSANLPFKDFLKRLEEGVSKVYGKSGLKDRPTAIGVGAPNANLLTGFMEFPPNFSWGDSVPLKKQLEKMLELPVVIANDANAAALGELEFGLGQKMRNFVVLTLGTGLGSGIILSEKLHTGAYGMAGELGHVSVDPDGRHCNCGLKGCLETYASVTGIKRTAFELMADSNAASPLRTESFNDMTGEFIAHAALDGDKIALQAFKTTGSILGSKMADTAAHLEPEAFILAGGLTKAGNILLDPIKESMERNLFRCYRGKIKVLISSTLENKAVLGPAALAFRYFRSNPK